MVGVQFESVGEERLEHLGYLLFGGVDGIRGFDSVRKRVTKFARNTGDAVGIDAEKAAMKESAASGKFA